MLQLTKQYLLEKAEKLGVVIPGIGFGPDHVHIFVCNWKNYSIPKLAKGFKGYVSKKMRENHWDLFRDKLWGKKFWSSGYFHRTIGSVTKDAMGFYIKNSQSRHWQKVDYDVYMHQKQLTLKQFAN